MICRDGFPASGVLAAEPKGLRVSQRRGRPMKTHLAIAASIIALATAPALAGSHDAHDHEFPLSMEDFMTAYPDTTPDEFAVIDSDGDGMVSEDRPRVRPSDSMPSTVHCVTSASPCPSR